MASKRVLLLLSAISLGLPAVVVGQITPANVLMGSFQQQSFQLPGYSQVSWQVVPAQGAGSISPNGVYTAPSLAGFQSTKVVFIYAQPVGGPSAMTVVYLVPGHSAAAAPPTPVYNQGPTIAPLNISITLSPGSVSLQHGQSVTFTPTVQGTNNRLVQWSMSPSIGILTTNGVYTAPASIGSDMQVTISARSLADSTKIASSTITLTPPVAAPPPPQPPAPLVVTLSPQTVTLTPGQTATFTPTVTGTSNTGLIWNLNPPVGTITNGVYHAPATITAKQVVTIRITSVVSSAATYTSKVTLQPASSSSAPPPTVVSIGLAPGTITLTGGQKKTFTPTVTGSSNTAVTWSFTPQVGTLTNGVYQAPAVIASQQTVTVKATSVADTTKFASSTITLTPIAVTVGPSSVTLAAGKTATFTASVAGNSNQAVTWSLTPNVGTISNGVYTAPSTIASDQKVTVTATSAADTTKLATATVNLSAAQPSTSITLPIEVMGADGTTAGVSFSIPSGANVSGPTTLWLQVHGVKYDSEASVQVNNSAWFPLSTGRVTLLGNAAVFGGIGGGFHTLEMTLALPQGTVVAGTNTITFRFNGTDGVTSGYRVLGFNIASAGTNVLPSSLFVQDDPNNWVAPSSSGSDIAAGKTLYQTASLTTVNGRIQAHCSDCHTQDGRDLKYFNYSNNSIRVRSMFHGLSAQQGDQIASYIRSLNVPNPGRPWNPPYQPGAGLDSQPVTNWAAGAGLDAVLDNDSEMMPYMAPGGSTAGWAANAYLNPRELPIMMQLPDWNSWLPVIHPTDSFGARFTNNKVSTLFSTIRNNLVPNSPSAYHWTLFQLSAFEQWFQAEDAYLVPLETVNQAAGWPGNTRTQVYSTALWMMVKLWEVNQEFGLEAMPQVPFGAKANVRGWFGNRPFFTSPNMLHITAGPGIGNGSQVARDYLALAWYQTQLILNDGQGTQSNHEPIDFGYTFGKVYDLFHVDSNIPGVNLLLAWQIKSLQEFAQDGIGPQQGRQELGWDPLHTNPGTLMYGGNLPLWSATSPAAQTSILQTTLQNWFAEASQFTPQQYYQGGWANANDNPAIMNQDNTFGGMMWDVLPRYRFFGVDPALVARVTAWAATIWPKADWAFNGSATCTTALNCTSGY